MQKLQPSPRGEGDHATRDRVRGLLLATLPKNLTEEVKFQTPSLPAINAIGENVRRHLVNLSRTPVN